MENYLLINGYKCFLSQLIPLRKLTVLAGSNSVGKSSVIQCVLLQRLAHEKTSAGINKIPLNDEYALGLGNTFNIINKNHPSESIALNLSFGSHIERTAIFADILEAQVFVKIIEPVAPRVWFGRMPDHPLLKQNFHYLNAERLGPRPFYNVKDSGRNVGCQGENTISLLSSSAVETPEYDVSKEKMFPYTENPRLLRQVQAWMSHIIPGIEIDPKKVQETNLSYVQYGGSTPHNVGFGISYVLPIVVAGLIAQKGEMLIVENPEAHLHPSGQSRIGQFLAVVAASGIEVLVETHSEHVINGIRIAALEECISHKDVVINFFSASEEKDSAQPKVNSIFLNENADLEKWPKGFFDQQQADIAKIFKLRKQKNQ